MSAAIDNEDLEELSISMTPKDRRNSARPSDALPTIAHPPAASADEGKAANRRVEFVKK